LINAITAAVASHASFSEAILPWIALLGALWFGATLAYRAYEALDVATSPRMRALAQKYLFTYLMGHSPRYFQENFAGKLGQKVKQAGQASVSILNILAFEMVRVAMLMLVGGVLILRARDVCRCAGGRRSISHRRGLARRASCCPRRFRTRSPPPPGA
jgi:ATP-binding cassette subfamily B protein